MSRARPTNCDDVFPRHAEHSNAERNEQQKSRNNPQNRRREENQVQVFVAEKKVELLFQFSIN